MGKHHQYFFLDLCAMGIRNKNGLSDSKLSQEIHQDRSWLNKIRKKAGKNGCKPNEVKIREEDAHRLAGVLDCVIDDIGHGAVVDPIDVFYEDGARADLEKILKTNPQFAADLLRLVSEIEPEMQNCLLAAFQVFQKPLPVKAADTWFRYLLVISLGKLLLPGISKTTESQLRREYDQKKGASTDYDKKVSDMKAVIGPKMRKVFNGLGIEDWVKNCDGTPDERRIEEQIEECAKFMMMYFDCPSSSSTKFVELYKKGIWCFSI